MLGGRGNERGPCRCVGCRFATAFPGVIQSVPALSKKSLVVPKLELLEYLVELGVDS